MVGERLGDGRRGDPARPIKPAVVAEAQERFHADGRPAAEGVVRDEVLASWERSPGVAPALDHAPVNPDAPERWRSTRVAAAFASVEDELVQIARDGDFVAAVTDQTGTIVWTAGGRTMRGRAERVAFMPGGRWDENAVGTNALALALRSGRPSAVFATEHFAPMVHDWVCYSAPIDDPVLGTRIGVLDLSTTYSKAHPLALSTVSALARNLSHAIGAATVRTGPVLALRCLGASDVWLDGVRCLLPPRQVELLALLSLHPGGLSLEALHDRLHGDRQANPTTTKAELSHLRRRVGDMIGSRPYRTAGTWHVDHLDLVDALGDGRIDQALELYRGPLLPRSTSPTIEEHREVLAAAIRAAVVAAPTPQRLALLRQAMPGDPYLADLSAP